MNIPRIYGVYLNNLSWHQIKNIYKESFKDGSAKYKIDRINEIIQNLDELPKHEIIEEYLFAGRIATNFYKLKDVDSNNISNIIRKLDKISEDIFTGNYYPDLDDNFKIVHAVETKEKDKLFITLALGEYKNSNYIEGYELKTFSSEYCCTAVFRKDTRILEIRANETLRGSVLSVLINELDIKTETDFGKNVITQEEFMNFKKAIPESQIKKYKGKSLNATSLTELFEYTARQDVDYAQHITEFETMREELKDLSLTMIFEFQNSTFPFRLNLLTGSIYFPSIISESAIDYIFSFYAEEFLGGRYAN